MTITTDKPGALASQPGGAAEELVSALEELDAAVLRVTPGTWAVAPMGPRSAALLELAGGTEPDAETFWSRMGGAQRGEVRRVLQEVARDGRTRTVEHGLTLASGLERWFRTCVKQGGSGPGAPLWCVMLDATASRHNERQWREVEAWLVTLGETLPFDFWICDQEGRCVLQNPPSRSHLGNALGQPLHQVMRPAASRAHWEASFGAALQGQFIREELEYEVGGLLRAFVRVVAPVRGVDHIQGVLGLDLDITDLKLTEEKLRSSLKELSLAQHTLVRRTQLAALGEMAGVVAHEVRNPLGSIANAVALLRRETASAPGGAPPLYQVIDDEVQRLDALVSKLLDFVRPMRTELSPRPLHSVVDDALRLTLSATPAERIRVEREVDDQLTPLMDVQLLGMALMNIFRNSVQAMAGEGRIRIRIEREATEDVAWAKLSIQDSGPGLPDEVRQRIFEPFVTTRASGTGLGLSIVRRVVEDHRGRLDVHSAPGAGTTCVMWLPLSP